MSANCAAYTRPVSVTAKTTVSTAPSFRSSGAFPADFCGLIDGSSSFSSIGLFDEEGMVLSTSISRLSDACGLWVTEMVGLEEQLRSAELPSKVRSATFFFIAEDGARRRERQGREVGAGNGSEGHPAQSRVDILQKILDVHAENFAG